MMEQQMNAHDSRCFFRLQVDPKKSRHGENSEIETTRLPASVGILAFRMQIQRWVMITIITEKSNNRGLIAHLWQSGPSLLLGNVWENEVQPPDGMGYPDNLLALSSFFFP